MYDQDPPIPCDDEYWDTGHPETSFKQPAGIPSKLDYFVSYVKLMEIEAATMRAVVRCFYKLDVDGVLMSPKYYTKKPDLVTARPTDQQTITMLDSALNDWFNSLPPHRE